MPLFLCSIYDVLGARPNDEDLGIAQLCYVQQRVIGCLVVGAEERAADGSGAVPSIGLRGGFFCEVVGALEVFDEVRRRCGRVGCCFDLEGPEVGD